MIRYLSIRHVLTLHERIAAISGGGIGVRDAGLLESALDLAAGTLDRQGLEEWLERRCHRLGE